MKAVLLPAGFGNRRIEFFFTSIKEFKSAHFKVLILHMTESAHSIFFAIFIIHFLLLVKPFFSSTTVYCYTATSSS